MPVIKSKVILILLLILVTQNYSAANTKLDGLGKFIKEAMRIYEVPGLSVAVVKNDKIDYLKGFGTKTFGKNDPVDKNTVFALGSASKNFTAAILGTLKTEGKLDWDSKLSDLIPGFRVEDPYVTREATIRDALAHRTAVTSYDLFWRNPALSKAQVVEKLAHFPQAASFRSKSLYNNSMYIAAGLAAEKVAGKSFDELLKERFFKPLGMTNSHSSFKKLLSSKNTAFPHEVIEGKLTTVNYANMNVAAPAGGINSSAADMAQWCRMYLNDGKVDGKQIIAEDILKDMFTPQIVLPLPKRPLEISKPMNGPAFGQQYRSYGLGLRQTDYRAKTSVVSHGGNIDGMFSFLVIFPKEKLCITALSNIGSERMLVTHIVDWIAARYLDIDNTKIIDVVKREFEYEESRRGGMDKFLASIKQKNTKPTANLDAYVGTYSNKAFGVIKISKENNKLKITLNDFFIGLLEHFHFDTFLTHWNDMNQKNYLGKIPFQFSMGHDQKQALVIQVLGDDSLVFKRVKK